MMEHDPSTIDTPVGASGRVVQDDRACVACGYNLFGLEEPPRCPECGLLNIPEEFRRQVHELVDSGKWFLSGFFSPFRKRPPGWWWALDRPGDVRRSTLFAASYVSIAIAIIFLAAAGGDMIAVRVHQVRLTPVYSNDVPTDSQGTPTPEYYLQSTWEGSIGLGSMQSQIKPKLDPVAIEPKRAATISRATQMEIRWQTPTRFLWVAVPFSFWTVCLWAVPAMVGIWTQIRKGLPAFARAPRTILAASNYESHRLIYFALAFLVCCALDALLRAQVVAQRPSYSYLPLSPVLVWKLALSAVGVFGILGWIGPLRSDFTHQLIRSRLHLVRIVAMYALVLPLLFTIALSSVIPLLLMG